jgi:hypothetical protein
MPKPPIDKADDVAKALIKFFARNESKAARKIRYDMLGKMGPIDKGPLPSSPWKASYSKKAVAARKKAASKPKGGIKPDGMTTPTGRPVGRVAKTPVRRENLYAPIKGKSLARTSKEQYTAEWQANKMLKRDGFFDNLGGSKPRPDGKRSPQAKGSFTGTGSKRSKGAPTSKRSIDYEADAGRRQAAQDRREMGVGKPRVQKPKPKKDPPKDKGTGGVRTRPKPKPKKPSGGAARSSKPTGRYVDSKGRPLSMIDDWAKSRR